MSSAACEASIGNESDAVPQAITRSRSDEKDAYEEEEELDYEEEMDTGKNEEEGELSDDTADNTQAQVERVAKDKDEGIFSLLNCLTF